MWHDMSIQVEVFLHVCPCSSQIRVECHDIISVLGIGQLSCGSRSQCQPNFERGASQTKWKKHEDVKLMSHGQSGLFIKYSAHFDMGDLIIETLCVCVYIYMLDPPRLTVYDKRIQKNDLFKGRFG